VFEGLRLLSLDVRAILNRIYEDLQSLGKEIDCAIACISGGVDSSTSAKHINI
jgi:predicted PP-loop superfamily ATPase